MKTEEAISIQNETPSEANSLEYYKYLSERVEKSPLSFPPESPNPFFPEFSKKKKDKK